MIQWISAVVLGLILSVSTFAKIPESRMDGEDGKDIVEVTVGSKDHTILAKAVVASELVETLTGPGPYTIFAPTDKAFGKLPKGTLEDLMKPANKAKLRSILEHHAAAPKFDLAILKTLKEMDMVDGPKIKIETKKEAILADGIEVLAAIHAKNGIIYVVDSVLLGK